MIGLHYRIDTWTEYCGGRMFVVGFTDGGAPYGPVEWPTTSTPDVTELDDAWMADGENAEPF